MTSSPASTPARREPSTVMVIVLMVGTVGWLWTSSSALAAKLREPLQGLVDEIDSEMKKLRTIESSEHPFVEFVAKVQVEAVVNKAIVNAADKIYLIAAQATDKAAAVEKVIELCLGDIKANRNPSYDGGWVDALNWVIGKNPDADKLYGPGPLAILTDSQPKATAKQRASKGSGTR